MSRQQRKQEIQKMLMDKVLTISVKFNKVQKNIRRMKRKLKTCNNNFQTNYYLNQIKSAEINAQDLINQFLRAIDDKRINFLFSKPHTKYLKLNIIDHLPD